MRFRTSLPDTLVQALKVHVAPAILLLTVCNSRAMKDPVTFAVAQCPFLAKVAAQNGNDYARSIATNPTEVATAQGPDSLQQYEASFQLFHGPSGIVPLVHRTSNTKPVAVGVCPFHAQRAAAAAASEAAPPSVTSSKPLPRTLPLATISLSFGAGANFGDFLRKQLHNNSHSKKRPPQQHRQPPSSNNSHLANSGSSGPGHSPTNTNPHGPSPGNSSSNSLNRPQRPLTDPTGSINSGSAGSSGFSSSSTSKGPGGLGSSPSGVGTGVNPNASSPVMQNSAATASGTSVVNSTAAASPSTFNPISSTGGAGCSSSSTTAAGFKGSSSSSSSGGINGPGAGSSPFKGSVGSSSNSGGGFMGRNKTRSGLSCNGSSSNRSPANGSGGPARGPKLPGSTSNKIASSSSSSSAAPPSKCPARKWLGPFAGLVFNEYDKIVCPQAIVAARAALAKTAAVQQLRPQQLPVKLVTVAAVAAAANVPAGAVREHFEKFSLGWFIAVHATIPFVAMLRKAVIMPKYSILVTIASAVIGQMVGARLERARLLNQQAAAAPHIAGSPIAASSSSSGGAASMSKVVRDSNWHEKLIAGGVAGFDTPDQDSNHGAAAAAAVGAAAACGAAMVGNTAGVVGLGSLLSKFPVVKA